MTRTMPYTMQNTYMMDDDTHGSLATMAIGLGQTNLKVSSILPSRGPIRGNPPSPRPSMEKGDIMASESPRRWPRRVF